MARNLYRFYLYIVSIALLIFGVYALNRLLDTLFALTPLRAPYRPVPSASEVIQSVVFAVVSLTIVIVLGGLHYWMIRRDMQSDATAGESAIRSFFLNISEAIGVSLAVPITGLGVLATIGRVYYSDVAGSLALAISLLVFVLLLELERHRTPLNRGAALAFQRLHFYGVQIILLVILTAAWLNDFRGLVDNLFFGGRGALEACRSQGISDCSVYSDTIAWQIFIGQTLELLWLAAFWIGYGYLTRRDTSPLPRLILHGLQIAYGIGFTLYGLYVTFTLLLAYPFGIPITLSQVLGFSGPRYSFHVYLIFGLLVTAIYHLWLRSAAIQGLIDSAILSFTEYTIVAILAAVAFWWGIAYLLLNTLEALAPAPNPPDPFAWTSAISLAVVGLFYIPLDIYLGRQNAIKPDVVSGPRRGLILALVGAGILSFAIGGAVALYAWATALFGSPITNWVQIARNGLVAFIVGVCLLGIYLWTVRREKLLEGFFKLPTEARKVTVPSAPVETESVEHILDELLAGRVTREEAAARIHALRPA